jgi:hypothetical protein
MKTLKVWIVTVILLLTFMSTQAIASPDPGHRDSTGRATESDEVMVILARLDEISAMDKSTLTPSEAKDLQKEVKASEKRIKRIRGGVFSSRFSHLVYRFTVAMRF